MAAQPDDPVQAKLIEVRRSQILDAATQVFAEKGFHRSTIRDVARTAGIADGTIYNYFENKDALLMGILNRLNETDERASDFAQAEAVGLDEWGRQYFRQRFEMLSGEGLKVMQVVISEILTNRDLREMYMQQIIQPTFKVSEEYFKGWVERGEVADIDVPLALRAISGMILGVLLLRMMGDPVLEAKWDDLPDLMAEIVQHGIHREAK